MPTPFETFAAGKERAAQMNAITTAMQQLVAIHNHLEEQKQDNVQIARAIHMGIDVGITKAELMEAMKSRISASKTVNETFVALAEELEKRWGICA